MSVSVSCCLQSLSRASDKDDHNDSKDEEQEILKHKHDSENNNNVIVVHPSKPNGHTAGNDSKLKLIPKAWKLIIFQGKFCIIEVTNQLQSISGVSPDNASGSSGKSISEHNADSGHPDSPDDDGLGPLPPNWEKAFTDKGEPYFIDHNTGEWMIS